MSIAARFKFRKNGKQKEPGGLVRKDKTAELYRKLNKKLQTIEYKNFIFFSYRNGSIAFMYYLMLMVCKCKYLVSHNLSSLVSVCSSQSSINNLPLPTTNYSLPTAYCLMLTTFSVSSNSLFK